MIVLWVIVVAVALLAVFIRVSPNDPARFHVEPRVSGNKDMMGGVARRVKTGPDGLARFHAVALGAPRTKVLAASVEEGHVTYVSRSKWMGFPDLATAKQEGDDLLIYARQRFGRKDYGVNKARIDGWLARMGM